MSASCGTDTSLLRAQLLQPRKRSGRFDNAAGTSNSKGHAVRIAVATPRVSSPWWRKAARGDVTLRQAGVARGGSRVWKDKALNEVNGTIMDPGQGLRWTCIAD